MEWQLILALVLGIPVALIGVLFVWYLNVSGMYTVIRERKKRLARQKALKVAARER